MENASQRMKLPDAKKISVGSRRLIKPHKAEALKQWAAAMAWRFVIIGVIIAGWEMIVRLEWVNAFLLGSPSAILQSTVSMIQSGQLFTDAYATVKATVIGFAVGSLIGSLAGLLLWFSKKLSRVIDPFVVALNGVPKIALAPLIIIWFGSGIFSKIALASIATLIVALLSAYQATHQIDQSQIHLMKSFGAKRSQIFTKIIVPSSLPWIISAFRINIGLALVSVVGGEFISSDKGLGHMIFVEGNLFNLPAVWVGVFTLMLVATCLYTIVSFVEKWILPWNDNKQMSNKSAGV
ncbi:ABC transporter permease [Paenibacillus sp. FSL H8-0548]|uniref:ABC transporter permease n=1 Tax=Paenibacillus sp. FSL H8-0548 TaxID=1920422 RepID=UPI00096F02EB|nr:ABC transporter permease [Paenibacillus sp. FSL H8-0548]OMF29059.1 ABC transporter permease [Paenibacillus sp. FSL H8-0548]